MKIIIVDEKMYETRKPNGGFTYKYNVIIKVLMKCMVPCIIQTVSLRIKQKKKKVSEILAVAKGKIKGVLIIRKKEKLSWKMVESYRSSLRNLE